MLLTIYVPVDPALKAVIRGGSGIVGSPAGGDKGLILVDYEGGLYGCADHRTLAGRLYHAAGRHVQRYPTVARMMAPADKLQAVGTYCTDRWEIVDVTDLDAVEAWLGDQDDPIRRGDLSGPR